MKNVFIAVLIFYLILPLAYSWGFETHVWICEQLYNGNNGLKKILDKNEFLRGCNAPDIEFDDQNYHNCYMARECKKINVTKIAPATFTYFSDINDCYTGKPLSCPALERFNNSIDIAMSSNFSYYVGASVHYYTDAFVPLHQVTGEDYWNCHSPFENQIDEKLAKNKRFWKISQECTFYFPCRATEKTIRKCPNVYKANIEFSYEDMVEVVKQTDNALAAKLNISTGDYYYLQSGKATGFLIAIIDRIISILKSIFG